MIEIQYIHNLIAIPALPFIIAMCSVGLIDVAMSPSMILDKVPVFLDGVKMPQWLRKPLYQCSTCNAGQIALWTYLIVFWSVYHIVFHVVIVLCAIFIAKAFKKSLNL